ncbi:MAG: TM0996/MTH895 family glutaredoxin-like protein [Deltaproteobacteria bacterium]|nr:TM0996/MTH895 family glutaredoxin-like protein [Deltaproteobacteria bacterium]
MKVKILGTGCPKCNRLYQEAEKAIAASGHDAELIKVQEIDNILSYGVMMTPALVVNEEVKSMGKVPKTEEIVAWIHAAMEG